jgi:prevent-host-death family protein
MQQGRCSGREGIKEEMGSYEAKTRLPELLRRASQGESFTITVHGKAVADIVPSGHIHRERAATAIASLLARRKATVSDADLEAFRSAGRK